jgi:tyrosyl-tRNA synthetase
VTINEEKVAGFNTTVTPTDGAILRAGKRKFAQLKLV